MYYAVYVFGPHWDKLRTGTPCGHNCVFLEPLQVTFKPAEYDVKLVENTKELDELKAIIAKREIAGQPMALSDIENLAIAKHPDNVFFLNDNTR
jgi:hypothetical protein